MARGKKGRSSRRRRRGQRKQYQTMLLTRRNYQLILIGVAMIFVGYALMWLDADVDGFLSLYVAPLILFAGYLEIIYALLWRPKEARESDISLEEALEAESEGHPV